MNVVCKNCNTTENTENYIEKHKVPYRRRYFNLTDTQIEPQHYNTLWSLTEDCTEIVPIDINQDGHLDIFCHFYNDAGVKDFKVIYNNVQIDNFFLKALMIYKNKNEQHSIISGAAPTVVGNSVIGASLRFVITSLDDKKTIRVGSQQVQTAYNAMLPPYSLVGIGRSNNYIESLNSAFAFMPSEGEQHIMMKTPIIPNSQIIITANTEPADKWGVELFANPDKNVYVIMITCALVLFLIGIIIIVLHVLEKANDIDKIKLPDF